MDYQSILSDRKTHDKAVADGFRAKLDFESLISGQLFIALDFFKDAASADLHEEGRFRSV